jgi:LysM repeat protein
MATVVLLAVGVAGLVGCGGDVRNDPFIVEKFKELDSQIAKSRDLPQKIQELNEEMVSLRDEIARLKGVGGATSTPLAVAAQLRAVSVKMQELEGRLQALELAYKSRPPAAIAPKATPAPTPVVTPAPKAAAPTPAPTPKVTPMALRTTPAAAATTKTISTAKGGAPPKSGSPTTPKATGPKAATGASEGGRGQYYVSVGGDTVKSIAARFKVSVEELCKENTFLKPDSVLAPGDRCWVPSPKK